MKLLFFLCLLPIHQLCAQQLFEPPAPLALQTYFSSWHSPWTAIADPSSLAMVKGWNAGLGQEQRFGLKALGEWSGLLALPLQDGGLQCSFATTSAAHWRSSRMGLSYGRSFGDLRAGLQLIYARNGKGTAVQQDLSTVVAMGGAFSKKVQWRVRMTRPEAVLQTKESGPSWSTSAGLGFQPGEGLLLAFEGNGCPEGKVALRTAVFYRAHPKLWFKGGWLSDSRMFFAGASFQTGGWALSITAAPHPYLGWSPLVSFSWQQKDSQ